MKKCETVGDLYVCYQDKGLPCCGQCQEKDRAKIGVKTMSMKGRLRPAWTCQARVVMELVHLDTSHLKRKSYLHLPEYSCTEFTLTDGFRT